MKKYTTNENGYTLVLSVFLILFVSIIGISLLRISANSLNQVDHERTDQAVYYIAEAGLTISKENLKAEFKQIEELALKDLELIRQSKPDYSKDELQNLYNGILINNYFHKNYIRNYIDATDKIMQIAPHKKAMVTYIIEEDNLKSLAILVQSVGMIGDASTRTLRQYVQLDSDLFNFRQSPGDDGDKGHDEDPKPPSTSPLENFGAVSSGNIVLSEGAKIIGNAGSTGGTITLSGGSNIDGTIIEKVQANLQDYLPTFPQKKFEELENLPLPSNIEVAADADNKTNIINNGNFNATNYITNNYTLNLTTDTKFKSFNVDQNNNLTINVGDKEINLYIEDLNIKQGHIKVIGTGKLNLYVKKFSALKGSFNQNGNLEKVNFYYNGTTSLSFNNETQFYGSLINNTANVTLAGGAGVYGNILSGGTSLKISGGVNTNGQYIVAPNADLNLTGGGTIKGTVLTKSINASGGTSITFGKPLLPLPSDNQQPTIIIPEEPVTEIKELSPIVEI